MERIPVFAQPEPLLNYEGIALYIDEQCLWVRQGDSAAVRFESWNDLAADLRFGAGFNRIVREYIRLIRG